MQGNYNRGVASFSDHDCWRLFRFRRLDLMRLMHLLVVPINFEVKGGRNGSVLGEYAFLITLHRLRSLCRMFFYNLYEHNNVIFLFFSYTVLLVILQLWKIWKLYGATTTPLFKVFNTMLDWLYDNHRHRIVGNIHWYSDRFDHYNQVLFSCLLLMKYYMYY